MKTIQFSIMTEFEKMLSGDNYNSRDPDLLAIYQRTKALMKAYNSLDAKEIDRKKSLLKEIFGAIQSNVWIEAPFYCDYGINIEIGEHSFVHTNAVFLDSNKITIGKNALIGPGVHFYTAGHPLKATERIVEKNGNISYLTNSQPIHIGDNVWIGGNSCIMPGVFIGNGVTIGAGSVVTKNIPDGVLAFGNPCQIIRSLE